MAARLKAAEDRAAAERSRLASERDALNGQLQAIQIDQAVVAEASKRKLKASATPDVVARARATFRLVDGAPRAVEADGQTVRVGADGVSPLTVAGWVEGLVAEAPHLFEGNAGGGAAGNGAGGAAVAVGKNPFRRDSWNLTEQYRIEKSNPALAAQLRSGA